MRTAAEESGPQDYKFSSTVVPCKKMWTCSPNREWTEAHAHWHSGKSELCVHRENRLDEWSLSLLLREERRERRETERERTKEENDGRENERREERERRNETERREPLSLLPPPRVEVQNVSVCRFKTLPCVPAKRAHVFARFAGTHGSVLILHTETFWTYTQEFFLVPSRATRTTHHTPQTQPNTHKKQGKIQRALPASRLFSALPPLEAVKVLVSIMRSVSLSNKGKPLKLRHYDISRAHFQGTAQRLVYIKLPTSGNLLMWTWSLES